MHSASLTWFSTPAVCDSLAFSRAVYLVSSSLDKTLRVWNLFSHQLISTITTPSMPRCVAPTF